MENEKYCEFAIVIYETEATPVISKLIKLNKTEEYSLKTEFKIYNEHWEKLVKGIAPISCYQDPELRKILYNLHYTKTLEKYSRNIYELSKSFLRFELMRINLYLKHDNNNRLLMIISTDHKYPINAEYDTLSKRDIEECLTKSFAENGGFYLGFGILPTTKMALSKMED